MGNMRENIKKGGGMQKDTMRRTEAGWSMGESGGAADHHSKDCLFVANSERLINIEGVTSFLFRGDVFIFLLGA